ncbi:helix-turn-helix transcriptional regulator [Caproiciproducens galactitolivorans]|jgi:transcriptional regulator with XRE-family HTH domain|uniref:HTH-type transcriptional regulator ImmR n=1 Tax=Caproiciproducens galactitolivorans TaxID=642589 RepID=A0A4Z0YFX4_9FIRM|nr:helix-turn-helix transcriptional regulator [Caproiciproducens galactitolivorans]QEY34687.1 helix-turn-helix transcriptional regulator [Caproiciproducens galactitolivorans]TGJ75842.1 HTH-type transcriptional regulator ImmR [Caproiciproducens galactitolivorans]
MNNSFPRIITLLRKERGLSQKKAAEELGVSQALLSHYEKGIRECGLDFVVKAADFYDVSCDYLLGRSPHRSGATIKVEDIPEPDAIGKENVLKGSLLPVLNKKLIANSLNIIFGILQKAGNKSLTTEISAYLNLAIYKSFRLLYSANPKNPQGMFAVPQKLSDGRSSAAQDIALSNASCVADGESVEDMKGLDKDKLPELSPEKISADYPLFASSLFNLIQNAETRMGAKKQTK